MSVIKINRAPLLTLWGAVVAERLGFDHDEALTLAKAVAGLNAQSKGQKLGIFEPASEEERQELRKREPDETFFVDLLGRAVPAVNTPDGLRALNKNRPDDPKSIQRYLERKFGENLDEVRAALEDLSASYPPEELARRAYRLYEQFRPEVPEGQRGWGAPGDLDLNKIRGLASTGAD